MRHTFFPKYAAWAAPFSPAGPEPMTMRSWSKWRVPGGEWLVRAMNEVGETTSH
jgi:hypothetical protein